MFQVDRGQPVFDLSACLSADDQAASSKTGKVIRQVRFGYAKKRNELSRELRPVEQRDENGLTYRVGEGQADPGQ